MSGAAGENSRRRRKHRHKTTDKTTTTTTTASQSQTLSLSSQSLRSSSRLKSLSLCDVSRPCQPRWVTRVDAADTNFRAAFADYLPAPHPSTAGVALKSADAEFRPRLPTNWLAFSLLIFFYIFSPKLALLLPVSYLCFHFIIADIFCQD